MKKSGLLIIALLASAAVLHAQERTKGESENIVVSDPLYHQWMVTNSESEKNLDGFSFPEVENFDGTYQFLPGKIKSYQIDPEFFRLIEQQRRENENINLQLNEDLTVFIYSRNTIQGNDFRPFNKPYSVRRVVFGNR